MSGIHSSNTPFDLSVRAPRSARVRLGGYAILPRMLDKARAKAFGNAGEYHFDCPMDNRFLSFVGLKADQIFDLVKQEKGDGEILEWIEANSPSKRTQSEILAWSQFQEGRAPSDLESHKYFIGLVEKCAPKRSDIGSWFDLLDVDDFVSFGGRA